MSSFIVLWKYLLVLPHLLVFRISAINVKRNIQEDIDEMNRRNGICEGLAFYLIHFKPYRNIFYYRVKRMTRWLSKLLPEYELFYISPSVQSIGGGIYVLNHPYGTIINCSKIGKNFTVCQLTTIGNGRHGRNDLIATIGDNVSLGANVNIIGKITIGNNVLVGAGSVVVKDVPNNCVVVGNPARVVKVINSNESQS